MSEREEQLKQIRERLTAHRIEVDNYRGLEWAEGDALRYYKAPDDVDFLLSLLDSQVVEAFSGPCVHCGHNNYDAERGECKQRWMEGHYSVVCGCPCAKHNSLANAATRMRDACVVHLRATADALDVRQKTECPRGTAFYYEARLRRQIATELQSLTLDQVEQKQ